MFNCVAQRLFEDADSCRKWFMAINLASVGLPFLFRFIIMFVNLISNSGSPNESLCTPRSCFASLARSLTVPSPLQPRSLTTRLVSLHFRRSSLACTRFQTRTRGKCKTLALCWDGRTLESGSCFASFICSYSLPPTCFSSDALCEWRDTLIGPLLCCVVLLLLPLLAPLTPMLSPRDRARMQHRKILCECWARQSISAR